MRLCARSTGSRLMSSFLAMVTLSLWAAFAVSRQDALPPVIQSEEHHSRSHDFDVQHIKLAVRFNQATKTVIGEVTHTIKPFRSHFQTVNLDAVGLRIKSVTLSNGTPLSFETYPDHLLIELDRPYRSGETITFTISYTAINPQRGIHFVQPDTGYPNTPRQIWSQGEAEETRYWIPLYDHPNDKATTETLVTVPADDFALSNGKLLEVKKNRDGTKTYHWMMSHPHSSYLITVAAGKFVQIKDGAYHGIPILSYVPPNRIDDAGRSFGKTPAMVQYFSEHIGYPYPWSKYAQIAMHDFGGGMENTSATTETDRTLHDERAQLDVSSDGLVAHELAHQWWGDTVTCRDWSDLWLNEGFATYFETLWTEHDRGWDEAAYERLRSAEGYLNFEPRRRRPIVTHRYSNPDEMFDSTTYSKGGLVLHMLRFVLGDELFWRSLNHYIREHEFQPVDTHDLERAIEEATGQNLWWFFDEWVYKAGHPDMAVSDDYDALHRMLRLTVKQTQTVTEQVPVFKMPVLIEVVTPSTKQHYRVVIEKAEQTFYFPLAERPLMVRFDKGNWLLKSLTFPKSTQEWLYQLKHDEDVIGRIRAARALKDHMDEEPVVTALGQALWHDSFWGVRREVAQVMGGTSRQRVREFLIQGYKDRSSRVRRAVVSALSSYKDEATVAFLKQAFEHDPSYFVAAAAVSAIADIGSPQARDVLMAALKRDSYRQVIRSAALSGFARIKDEQAIPLLLKYAAYGQSPDLRPAAVRALGALGKGHEDVVNFLITLLRDKQGLVQLTAVHALAAMGSARAIKPLQGLQQTAASAVLKHAASQAIERIRRARRAGEKVPERKPA